MGKDRDRLREGDSYDERNCIILICERRKGGRRGEEGRRVVHLRRSD
jgi:hypothetical protein